MTEYPKPNDNTYKEIWRALSCLAASYPPETLFVTEDGKIGIEVDGVVTTLSAREWFAAGICDRGLSPQLVRQNLLKQAQALQDAQAMVEKAAAAKPLTGFHHEIQVMRHIHKAIIDQVNNYPVYGLDIEKAEMDNRICKIANALEKVLIHLEGEKRCVLSK